MVPLFDLVVLRETLTDASAKKPDEERYVKAAVNTSPSPTLIMIQAQFLLVLAKTIFDGPSPERDAKDLAKRPAVAARNPIAQEVFHLARQYVAGLDQRTFVAVQSSVFMNSISDLLNVT